MGKNIIARQQLKDTYFRNGVVYAFTRKIILKKNKSLLSKKSSGYIIDTPQISIDNLTDLKIARKLLKN